MLTAFFYNAAHCYAKYVRKSGDTTKQEPTSAWWRTVVPNGLNLPKISSLDVISRIFSSKF